MVLVDAIHYKVREKGTVVKKAVYIAIGTDLEGKKGVTLSLLFGIDKAGPEAYNNIHIIPT